MWELSHREFFRAIAAWAEEKREQHNRDMTLAWQTANLVKARRLPSLSRLLVKPQNERPQSVSEMRTMLHRLSAKYGGKVREIHGR